jgi:uncharacterized protein
VRGAFTPQQLAGLLGGLVAVQFAAGRLALWLAAELGAEATAGAPFLLATLGLPSAAGVAWIWFMAVWREPGGWSALGLTPLSPHWLRLSLLAAVGCYALGVATAMLFAPLFGMPKGPPAPIRPGQVDVTLGFVASFVLTGVVLAPLLEELVFRGVVFAWLRRWMGFAPAAALAAAPHAAMHFDWGATPALFAIFVALAWLYERSGSLWTAAIAHGGHNLISMGLGLAAASRLS